VRGQLAQEAERLGYDSAWAAEAWGTDAVTVLTWLAATTSTIKIGSAIMQIPGRTPANTAMTAATLDLMSGGRFLLGLGTFGVAAVVILVVLAWTYQPVQFGDASGGSFAGLPTGTGLCTVNDFAFATGDIYVPGVRRLHQVARPRAPRPAR